MTAQEIISLIGLIGIGGLLKSLFDFFISNKRVKSDKKQELKETRYKAIILLCYTYMNYEDEGEKLKIHRPNIKSKEDLFNELKAEWVNMNLYSSDKVLLEMKKFLEFSDQRNFNKTILAMRKDLYGIKTNIKENDLSLDLSD